MASETKIFRNRSHPRLEDLIAQKIEERSRAAVLTALSEGASADDAALAGERARESGLILALEKRFSGLGIGPEQLFSDYCFEMGPYSVTVTKI